MDQCRREWETLWEIDSTAGVVIEDLAEKSDPICRALMVCAFITDKFADEALNAKEPFILARIAEDPFALVPFAEFAEHNAESGLNLLIAYIGWEGNAYDETAPNLRAMALGAWLERHGGNRIKLLFGEVASPEIVEVTVRTGGLILNDYSEWWAANRRKKNIRRPYLVGTPREHAMRHENTWLTRLFTYFPPRFHFTNQQKDVLRLAREGLTDTEVAAELGISADAVKKRWTSSYERVKDVFPNLLPENPMGTRGSEKRRALLGHLRERPEELRPYPSEVRLTEEPRAENGGE